MFSAISKAIFAPKVSILQTSIIYLVKRRFLRWLKVFNFFPFFFVSIKHKKYCFKNVLGSFSGDEAAGHHFDVGLPGSIERGAIVENQLSFLI
jgi:hypothetical protein